MFALSLGGSDERDRCVETPCTLLADQSAQDDVVTNDITHIWPRVLEDDDTAWRELVAVYAPLVFSVARACGLDRTGAEDCAQQVWISLYRNRSRVREPQRLLAWLKQTTRRRAIRMTQQQSARNRREQIHADNRPASLEPIDLAEIEDQLLLESAMARLQPRCRWLLHQLFFAEKEMTYEHIARALGLSINTLGPLRARCLTRLKKILEKIGYRVD